MSSTTTRQVPRKYVDPATGEIYFLSPADSTEMTDRNFHKVFMKNFLKAMGSIGNRKAEVAYFIIRNLTPDNKYRYSYRQTANLTGVSYQTVARTIRTLMDADFLRRSGKELIANPDMLFKGYHGSRQYALAEFENAKANDKQIRLKQLEKTIAVLSREAEELSREINAEKDRERLAQMEM